MPRLKDHAIKLRSAIVKSIRYAGPPVLIESAKPGKDVIILPPASEDDESRTTRRLALASFDERERSEPMMALIDLVAPSSTLFELAKRSGAEGEGIRIGRERANDIVLLDDTISNRHAVVTVHDGLAVVSDQGSSNGTFVNQRRLDPGEVVNLDSGDCVRLGQRAFYYLTGSRLALFFKLWIESNQK